jgi:hypothetical protein
MQRYTKPDTGDREYTPMVLYKPGKYTLTQENVADVGARATM